MRSNLSVRYAPRQQLLHWLTAILMFATLPVAWVVVSLVEESKPFLLWMDVHESLGLVLLAATILRLAWRITDPVLAADPRTPRWSRLFAAAVHKGLLLLLILMPLSGYLWSTGHGHDVAPFHLLRFPRVAFGARHLGDIAKRVHVGCQWALYTLITLHLTGVGYHVFAKRDGLLSRMLPPQTPDASSAPQSPTFSAVQPTEDCAMPARTREMGT